MARAGCGCGGGCGNRSWDGDRLRRWSEAHSGAAELRTRHLAPPQPFRAPPRKSASIADPIDASLAGRPAREYQTFLSARWRGPSRPVAACSADLRPLEGVESLWLGQSLRWGPLIASLPRGQRPVPVGGSALDLVLHAHDPATRRWQMARAGAGVRGRCSERPGLHWRGESGPQRGAWALGSWRARGGGEGRPVWTGPMPARYADQVAPDRSEIRVDGDGVARLAGTAPLVSWTQDSHHALEQARGVAGMADLHLWWAERLYSYHHTDSRSPWDLMLAAAAARRALYWIDRLAAEIRHLDGHATGGGTCA